MMDAPEIHDRVRIGCADSEYILEDRAASAENVSVSLYLLLVITNQCNINKVFSIPFQSNNNVEERGEDDDNKHANDNIENFFFVM